MEFVSPLKFDVNFSTDEICRNGRKAFCSDAIFPFEITYTLQKSGVPFNTTEAISFLMNSL